MTGLHGSPSGRTRENLGTLITDWEEVDRIDPRREFVTIEDAYELPENPKQLKTIMENDEDKFLAFRHSSNAPFFLEATGRSSVTQFSPPYGDADIDI